MKLSVGLSRGAAAAAFLARFVAGALLQANGMKDADMGPSYVPVIVAGIVWLRRT